MTAAVMHALAPFRGAALAVVSYLVLSVVIGIALALLAALVVRAWRRLDAAARYAVWYVALVATLLGPLAALVVTSQAHHETRTVTLTAALPAVPSPHTSRPFTLTVPRTVVAVPPALALAAAGLWLLIVLGGAFRFAAGAFVLARLKRDALPLAPDRRAALPLWRSHAGDEHARRARLCVSDRVEVPVAVGLFDGMVVLPQHVLDDFEPGDIDRFVLHELAHLERRDDWTAVVQRFIQMLLFFNPAVHAIARQLDLEREIACDDHVVAATSDVRSYAAGLTRMAESTAWPHRGIAAPAIFVTRRQLSLRVEQLLAGRRAGARSAVFAPALVVLVASLGVVAAAAPLAPSVGLAGASPARADAATRVIEARYVLLDKNGKKTIVTHDAGPGVVVVRSEYKTISAFQKAHGPMDRAHVHALLRQLEKDPHTSDADRRVLESFTQHPLP
ncbi:MAG TPA: M56 family metallopeptidase [Candidatus Elarobacter sp.]|jgi:beta-lactamase regulating signal transducer with metallopeptidase domain